MGERVRYDGEAKQIGNEILKTWIAENRIISVCPEVLGGLPIPRAPSEILKSGVQTQAGKDVTDAFNRGAQIVLRLAQKENVGVAILKERSPSCGSKQIYNGDFNGTLVKGKGITTLLLEAHGIQVFGESEIQLAFEYLDTL